MLRLRWLIVVVFCCVWLGFALPVHADWDPAFDCADVVDIPLEECEALQALYESTNGDDWTDNTGWGVSNHAAD